MVAQLFDTTQPDILDVAALAYLHRSRGLRVFAGWREPMGAQTQRAVTLTVGGQQSPDHLVVELMRLADVGAIALQVGAGRPDMQLDAAIERAKARDQVLQRLLGLTAGARGVIGQVQIEGER